MMLVCKNEARARMRGITENASVASVSVWKDSGKKLNRICVDDDTTFLWFLESNFYLVKIVWFFVLFPVSGFCVVRELARRVPGSNGLCAYACMIVGDSRSALVESRRGCGEKLIRKSFVDGVDLARFFQQLFTWWSWWAYFLLLLLVEKMEL